jgi:hypothetical protein
VAEPYAPFVASSKDAVGALKAQVLQLAASLDRGQAYNPTSGEYYRERFEVANTSLGISGAKHIFYA